MFKVECPGCKAPYQVDERRVPSSGLKMRCPKCGTSFQVEAPDDARRTGPNFVLGEGAPPPAAPQAPPARSPPRHPAAQTMVGMAPSMAPPPAAAPPVRAAHAAPIPRAAPLAPPPRAAPPPHATPDPYAGADLPAVGKRAPGVPPPVPPRVKQPPNAPGAPAPSADLPARVAKQPGSSELDLPSVAAAPPPGGARMRPPMDLDLPEVRGQQPAGADLPAAKTPELEWDLPAVGAAGLPEPAARRAASAAEFELDLPDLSADLPAPAAEQNRPLTAPTGGLPARKSTLRGERSAELPVVAGRLPALDGALPAAAAALPQKRAQEPLGFGELDLDAAGGGFGEIDLPPTPGSRSIPPLERSMSPAAGVTVAAIDAIEADPFGEATLGAPVSRQPAIKPPVPDVSEEVVRASGGGTSYGEVNLDGGPSSGVALDAPPVRSIAAGRADEDMEFGAVPQEGGAAAPAAMAPLQTRMPSLEPRLRKRAPARIFLGLLVVAVAGGSLSFVPALGPYGAYWISDRLNAGEHRRLLDESVTGARSELGRDSYPDAKRAFERLEAARGRAKRFKPLEHHQSYLGYLRELRFGSEPAIRARAEMLLGESVKESVGPELELARAARSVAEGKPDARPLVQALLASQPRNVDVLSLVGELELKQRNASAALAAWQRLAELEPSARSAFGLARAKHAARDAAGAEAAAKLTLERNPKHIGAQLLVAGLGMQTRQREAASLALLEGIARSVGQASPEEIVEAETLLGDFQLARSRISVAEAAYGRALKVNPRAARALAGLGEAMFRAGRHGEALARFDAGLQADPEDVTLQIGAAKSKLSLERIEEATRSLAKIVEKHPKHPVAALWYGHALEAAGARERATAVYRKSIADGALGPEHVNVHIALAMLLNQQGQAEEAQKVLASARQRLPDSSAVHRAVGEVALGQGRLSEAIAEFRRAVELEPDDLAARFKLGVALRRNQNYEEATRVFDEISKLDREHPGLALERGLLFEATGRSEDALKAYEGALAKAPGDADLMLRVGCGNITAGRAAAGEELLRKVLTMRPNSAEANHCLGRALLAASKLADAQRLLDRALELDPNHAEYHLYVGWAASEAGNVPKADRALAEALKLDSTLADAYWQRGVLRARQGAVRDAVQDLLRALEQNPARHEVHAALADAYFDLGRERDALSEWQKAVQAQPDNAHWRFRYGKLLVINHMNDAGRTQLEKAIDWAEKAEAPPRWLWEAHHLTARSLGAQKDAARHWEQFLRLGPRDSPYRTEAKQALKDLGRPWMGD